MELAPHIHWIEGVRGNVYACFEPERVTLIGTGRSSIDRIDLIFNYLARYDYYLNHLHKIIITHADPDVAGNIAEIQTEVRVPIYASAATKTWLAQGHAPDTGNRPRQFPAVNPETIVTLNQTDRLPILGGLHVITTAGFIPGHITLHNPLTGVLFCGDLFQNQNGILQSAAATSTIKKPQTQTSLQHLLTLCPTVFAPSQGSPVTDHTAAQLLQLTTLL